MVIRLDPILIKSLSELNQCNPLISLIQTDWDVQVHHKTGVSPGLLLYESMVAGSLRPYIVKESGSK